MSKSDFHFEFYSEVPDVSNKLRIEAEQRLRVLATNQTDMIGASVAIEELTGEETPHLYQARAVAYVRPENIAAVEKAALPEVAVMGALDAVERQVRQRRERFHQPWEQTDKANNMGVYELSAREIFDTYAEQADPAELISLDRTGIATKLMVEKGLDQEAAYYAADEMLAFAQELIDAQA